MPAKGPASRKKRAAHEERPKSREETPKEGSGNSRYRIAISYTATHKNQGQKGRFTCNSAWLEAEIAKQNR